MSPESDPPLALVTGANRGLGREVSRQLGGRGLGCRDVGRGGAVARELAAEGVTAVPVRLDVTDPVSVRDVAGRIRVDHGGRLDVLVNNAGIFVGARATEVTAEQLRPMFETNVLGAVTLVHTMAPLLARSAAPRVVNVSSTTASLTLTADGSDIPGDATVRMGYAGTKAALNMLTVQYAAAFAADPELAHVKVNAAAPGYTATDMNGHRGTRPVSEGARIIVDLAMLGADGPSGGFFNDRGVLPW
ncbi:SDR family NAD(P)-dependent oxidoreductase [Micromonospora sp. DH15]|nr:SDR family NAD(P)-dependent oxidoreductase [Micromonospora sp. DH15]